MRFKKIHKNALNKSEIELKLYLDNLPWRQFATTSKESSDEDFIFLEERFFIQNMRSAIHKAFLYLRPTYRQENKWPHKLSEVPEEIKNKFD